MSETEIKTLEEYKRFEDMSRDGWLSVFVQNDGDVLVTIWTHQDGFGNRAKHPTQVTAEFCTYAGGGHSQHTRAALIDLAKAIARDNQENKQFRKSL